MRYPQAETRIEPSSHLASMYGRSTQMVCLKVGTAARWTHSHIRDTFCTLTAPGQNGKPGRCQERKKKKKERKKKKRKKAVVPIAGPTRSSGLSTTAPGAAACLSFAEFVLKNNTKGTAPPRHSSSSPSVYTFVLQALARHVLFVQAVVCHLPSVHADGVVIQDEVKQEVLLQPRVCPRLHQRLVLLLLERAVGVLLAVLARGLRGIAWEHGCVGGRMYAAGAGGAYLYPTRRLVGGWVSFSVVWCDVAPRPDDLRPDDLFKHVCHSAWNLPKIARGSLSVLDFDTYRWPPESGRLGANARLYLLRQVKAPTDGSLARVFWGTWNMKGRVSFCGRLG